MITRLTGWSSAVWTSDGEELEDREEHVDADDSSPTESEIWKLPLRVLSGLMSLHGLQQEPWLTKKLAHLIATKCRNTFSTLSAENSNSMRMPEHLACLPSFPLEKNN